MKIQILIILFLLFIGHSVVAQTLPSNFTYKRETGQETGVPIFILNLSQDSIVYDSLNGNTFEALCALVQPERDKYGLMFFNVKTKYELHLKKNTGVTITINDENFEIETYTITGKRRLDKLYGETATIVINKTIFDKLIKADDVLIRVGTVKYNLDQDNIDAFHYFGKEIEKDIERRKPKQTKSVL